jgi:hypothetical protein
VLLTRWTVQRPYKYLKATHIHHHLQLGSISGAVKCLEELPLLHLSDEVLASFEDLRPPESTFYSPSACTQAAAVTEAIFCSLPQAAPRGSAGGLSGWTSEHIKAAASFSENALAAVSCLVSAIIWGILP